MLKMKSQSKNLLEIIYYSRGERNRWKNTEATFLTEITFQFFKYEHSVPVRLHHYATLGL